MFLTSLLDAGKVTFMFCIRNAFLNIKRHKRKSILIVAICILIVFFVCVYVNNIETSEEQLANLPSAIPVTANISNLVGSKIVGLEINEGWLLKTRDAATVKDMLYTAQILANFASMPDEEDAYKEIQIAAVSEARAISNIKDKKLEFMDGVDESCLMGKDAVCLASEDFLLQNGLEVGDTMELALYTRVYDSYSIAFHPETLGTSNLRIVGRITSEVFTTMDSALICPLGWARDLHVKVGQDMHYDSAAFTVADPLNLNAFKEEMDDIGWMDAIPTANESPKGESVRVRDETFIKTAENLKNNLAGLYTFLPIVFVVVALVGYAISYLLMQSRRRDIVLMRSLGVRRLACVMVMLLEFTALSLAGSLLGLAVSALLIGFASADTPLMAMLFFASFLLGIAVASVQLSGVNLMTGLNKTEE
jgi:hypothetical protein